MLLEGRGTAREIGTAVKYLQMASNGWHLEARNILARIEKRVRRLDAIGKNFNELNTADELAPKMPLKLQRAIVGLLMVEKGDDGTENLTITQHDITSAISDIGGFNKQSWYRKEILEAYLAGADGDASSLLAEGWVEYNRKKNTSIGIVTQECVIPKELWRYVGEFMPMEENVNLALTSRNHTHIHEDANSWRAKLKPDVASNNNMTFKQIFFGQVDARKAKYLPLTYLHQQGFTDPILIQKIRSGQLNLIGYEKIQQELKGITCKVKLNVLSNPLIQVLIAEGTFSLDQLSGVTKGGGDALLNPDIQNLLQQEKYRPSINLVLGFSESASACLVNPWVRNLIVERMLSLDQLSLVTEGGANAILDINVQNLLQLEKYRPAIELIIGFTAPAGACLTNPWIRKLIVEGKLSLDQLSGVTEGGADALLNPYVQSLLQQEKYRPYIELVLGFSEFAYACLKNFGVMDLIVEGRLSLNLLSVVTKGGADAIDNWSVRDFLRKNWWHIPKVVGLSLFASKAFINDWVRARITDETLTFDQLVGISEDQMNTICNPTIQGQQKDNQSIINEIFPPVIINYDDFDFFS
jgi:hypothetical protein